MKCARLLKRNVKTEWLVDNKYSDECAFTFKRVLILGKRSRYELEKSLRPGVTDSQFEKIIRKRGSDFDRILKSYNHHKEALQRIVQAFAKYDLDVKLVSRSDYSEKDVSWADLIVTGGGDGTFLLGASQIHNRNKPIIGFNTDPGKSEGYLCVPKKYSVDINSAVVKLLNNDFKWLMRNRIEVEVQGTSALEEKFVLDSTKKSCIPKYEMLQANDGDVYKRILPSLALNEVFMGEHVSSQTSSLFIHPEGFANTIVKCSGLCISTGTGSTSWHFSINRLTEDKVKRLMKMSGKTVDDAEVFKITQDYNSSLRFSPDDRRLYWSLREPIYNSVFPDPPGLPAGGFSKSVSVGSRCFSGCLVIDGTHWYRFPDGTMANLRSTPDKCLRTIHFN